MARRKPTRQPKAPIPTIIGAGITEQWYFTHIQRIFGYRLKIRPRFFGQEDVFQLSKKIEAVINDGGIAIVVFDADVASWDDKERQKFDALKRKYAKSKNVVLCDSMPSIEYWFLLHYEDIHRLFPTSASVISVLTKHISGYDKTDSFLRNQKWVDEMCADGKLTQAIERSENPAEGQSYTNIARAFNILK